MEDDRAVRRFRRHCLDYMDCILNEIRDLPEELYILDNEQLAALGVRKAEPLDIDEESVDFGPRFFIPRFTLAEARQKTVDFLADFEILEEWYERCRRGSFCVDHGCEDRDCTHEPEDFHPLCSPVTDAELRCRWFMGAAGGDCYRDWPTVCSSNLGVAEGSPWRYSKWNYFPSHHPRGVRVGQPPRLYHYQGVAVCTLEDSSSPGRPHIAGSVADGAEAGEGDVLRSEVETAVALLRHQFSRGDFKEHRILPAIVFSFQHDRRGRISQFHFDGYSPVLHLRQSRLLDFFSDEPTTTDAYHMLRWMANRPIGDTQFGAVDNGKQTPDLQNPHDRKGGKFPIQVPGM
ncbi:hypothetical protein VTK56DRAFT_3815 [Thermocarpiscus australiensis]